MANRTKLHGDNAPVADNNGLLGVAIAGTLATLVVPDGEAAANSPHPINPTPPLNQKSTTIPYFPYIPKLNPSSFGVLTSTDESVSSIARDAIERPSQPLPLALSNTTQRYFKLADNPTTAIPDWVIRPLGNCEWQTLSLKAEYTKSPAQASLGGPGPDPDPKPAGSTNEPSQHQPFGTSFFGINLAKASGIAMDAMMATLAKMQELSKNSIDTWVWAGGIAATHTVFPMIGFIGGYNLAHSPMAQAGIYASGGALITLFAAKVLQERAKLDDNILTKTWDKGEELLGNLLSPLKRLMPTNNQADGNSAVTNTEPESKVAKLVDSVKRLAFPIWAVSLDAVVQGIGSPAANQGWSPVEVYSSFPLVGALVGAGVFAARGVGLTIVDHVTKGEKINDEKIGRAFQAMGSLDLAAYAYFGVRAFVGAVHAYAPSMPNPDLLAIPLAVTAIGVVGAKVGGRLMKELYADGVAVSKLPD